MERERKKRKENHASMGTRSGGGDDAPWLVFTRGGHDRRIQILSTVPPNNNLYVKSIPELCGKQIRASYHGWLILTDFDDNYFHKISMWNHFTSQSIKLPALPSINLPRYVLTESPNCILFVFDKSRSKVYFCRPTSASIKWTYQRLELDDHHNIGRIATLNQILYFWKSIPDSSSIDGLFSYHLMSIQVDDDDDTVKCTSLGIVPPNSKYTMNMMDIKYYLVESCGFIYSVTFFKQHYGNEKICRVEVWVLDLDSKTWLEVDSLDGRAFFIGFDCYTWCWGSNSIRGDSIYSLTPDNFIYCHSLSHRSSTLHTLDPDFSLHTGMWVNAVLPQQHHCFLQRCVAIPEPDTKQLLQDDETHEQEEEGPFVHLPPELIHLISKHTHLFDCWNLRASCPQFRSLTPPPQWRSHNSLPLFIFFKSDLGLCQVMDPIQDYLHSNILRLSLDEPYLIGFSKDGWLIMHTQNKGYFFNFFNPFTKERLNFPFPSPLPVNNIRSIGFSTHPTSPDCITVAFSNHNEDIDIYYFQNGDEYWRSCNFPFVGSRYKTGTSSPVYFQGAFYVLDGSGKLGKFKLVDGEGNWEVYGRPFSNDPSLSSYHLIECNGELLGVFIGSMGKWVQVFKFDLCKEKWFKVKSLGEYSLFLGKSSFSVKIKEVEIRNRVYIQRFKGMSMIFYSLETCLFYVSGSGETLGDFCDTTEQMDCFWL